MSTPVVAGDELRAADLARGGPSRRGWYEVYYVTAALPGGRGIWLRWTLRSPREGAATAAVWGLAFDRARPQWFAARSDLPGSAWRPRPHSGIDVGDAELGPDQCRGGVTDTAGRVLRWDLHWSVLSRPFAYFPAALERIAAGATYAIVAVPAARADGVVEVDGERIECQGVPLEQSHLFGGHHAHRWAWVHAIGFDDDPEGYLTLIWAVPHRLGGRLPPVSSLALRVHGRELRPHGRQALRGVLWSDVGSDLARFSATLDGVSVEGEVQVPVQTLAGVVYHDPEGAEVYCANTEVADLTVRLRDRDGTPSSARCVAACGFERGTRGQLPPEVWRALS